MHRRLTAVTGLILALAVAAPVAASTTERFSFHDVIGDTYSCGAVLTTEISGDVTVHLATDGTWLSTTVRLRYAGVALDPATGRTVGLPGRQIVLERPGSATLVGQGIFIRLAGRGVLLGDVGRLVFDPGDGSTIFASAHVVPFDDPASAARIDAAVCGLFD